METLELVFETAVEDELTVVLTGFSWDTNNALKEGPACYDPFNGWHPREMTVSVGGVSVAGDRRTVTVEVAGAFEAGESLEAIRECIDAVNDQAQVLLTVEVLGIRSRQAAMRQSVQQEATYGYGSKAEPEPQPDPDPNERPLTLPTEGHVLGWSALSYRFHVSDLDRRGAYLRSLSFDLDAEAASAIGHATNYSPGTQISGFGYSFEGEAVAVPITGDYEAGRVELQLEPAVGEDREPVLTLTKI
jgi:hypothetical protein